MPTIPATDLTALAARIFLAHGASEAEANDVADHLVGANLAGHDSHGVIRIPVYVSMIEQGVIRPQAEITVERETANSAVLDGGRTFGQVTARRATEIAIEKARAATIGMVTAHECNHVGRVGAYTEQIAAAGLLGMAVVNNHGGGRLMAAYGGIEPRTSPNPISMAFPTGRPDQPFLVDMTASVVAGGKIMVKRNEGAPLPDGWAIRADGAPAATPEEYYGPPRGAILPMGANVAHKGFALALMVDVLGGALSGAACSNPDAEVGGNGLWVMAVDIEAFRPLADFQAETGRLLDYVKTPPYADGFDEILIPGEPEHRSAQRRRRDGIPVDDETWRQLNEVAAKAGVTV